MSVKTKRKSAKSSIEERPTKKLKSRFDPAEAGPSNSFSSLLSSTKAEADFPRGGGSSLTAVEIKAARAEGLAELRKFKQQKQQRKAKGKQPASKPSDKPKDVVSVVHLSYKNLDLGTRTMARIISIRPLELIVSLPDQLFGHVPLVAVSSHLTKSLEELANDSDEDEDSSDSDSEAPWRRVPTLQEMFEVGQYITAVVAEIKTADATRRTLSGPKKADEDYRRSRRVALSLDPAKVHEGMTKTDLVAGLTVSAAVQSIEDTGYVLDLGIEGVTAFVSHSDGDKVNKGRPLVKGQIVRCRVTKMSGNGRTCAVSVVASQDGFVLAEPPSASALLPDILMKGLITAVTPFGLAVKLFGLFDASVNLAQLQLKPGQDSLKAFKIGQKVKARVIWSAGQTVALSLLPHVVRSDHAAVDAVQEAFPIGLTLEAVKITRTEGDFGVACEIPGPSTDDPPVPAFVHLSKLTDEHIPSVFGASESFDAGTFHKARVVGFSAFEGIVQLSFQKSVLESEFLRVSDVKVGEAVKVTVNNLTSKALYVDMHGNVQGVVWPEHYSDIRLKHPEKRFKPGSALKARVFSVDPEKQRVVLTLKKSLLASELPVLASFDQAAAGQDHDAVVNKITETGALVEMFGGVRAFVPIAELSEDFLKDAKDIREQFAIGQATKIRLLNVDKNQRHILASVRRALHARELATRKSASDLAGGQPVKAKVLAIHSTQIVFGIEHFSTKGLLAISVAAYHQHADEQAVRDSWKVGQAIDTLQVMSVDADKDVAILGYGKRKAPATSISNAPTFDKLEEGQVLAGTFGLRKAASSIVSLGRGLSGRLHFTDAVDDYDRVEELLASTKPVDFQVLAIDRELKHVDVTSRASILSASAEDVKDPLISDLSDLQAYIGQDRRIRGFVVAIANAGVFVALSRDLTARVLIKELFDEFVQDWKSKFAIGQVVSGRILSVDEAKDEVEMSLRSANSAPKPKTISLSTFAAGQRVPVVVKKLEAYGVFLRVQNSSISGLCHRTEVRDGDNKTWDKDLSIGEELQAVILSVDPEKRRIAFSLKPSKVGVMSTQVSEQGDEDDNSLVIPLAADDDTEDSADIEDDDTAMPAAERIAVPVNHAQPLAVGASTFGPASSLKRTRDEELSSDDEDDAPASKVPKTTLQATDRTADIQSTQPTSSADFERLLLSSPNSSLLWISYMAHYASVSDLVGARKLARRALSTINFRELEEKFNVWVAWLSLENQYGSDADFDNVFQEAAKANNPKAVYLKACDLLTEQGKTERAEELHNEALKKFSESSKVWTLFAAFKFAISKPEDARTLLQRSLKVLPKRKHVKTVAKFAGLEFKMGDPEIGRTLFEGLFESQPKRLDLLSVFLDLESKAGNFGHVRSLFKRALERKLTTKKAKWLFKKYLAFEEAHGSSESQDEVKRMAAAFVARQQQQEATVGDASEED